MCLVVSRFSLVKGSWFASLYRPTRRVLQFCRFTSQSQPNSFWRSVSTCLYYIGGLPVCSWQDEKWIRENEEAPVNRGTSRPGTWCFVFSKFWPYLLGVIWICSLFATSDLASLWGHVMVSRYHQQCWWYRETSDIGRACLSFRRNLL